MRRFRTVISVGLLAGIAVLAAAFALTLNGAGTAYAHAAYVRSIPNANTVVKTAPTTVHITFIQKLSPQGLAITVYGNKADVVSTGTAQIDASDPYSASISMTGDGSDIYRVDWNNVSAEDGDPTLGAFVFGVDPSGVSDKVPPAATTTTPASPVPTILAGIIGLLLGSAATYFVTRPRPTVR